MKVLIKALHGRLQPPVQPFQLWRRGCNLKISRNKMGLRLQMNRVHPLELSGGVLNASGVRLAVPEAEPACGMKAEPAARSLTYEGNTYYFCSERSLAKFQAQPEKYAAKGDADGSRD